MLRYYSPERKKEILTQELGIQPQYIWDAKHQRFGDEMYVDAIGYSMILSWRARHEYGVDHTYVAATSRHHKSGHHAVTQRWINPVTLEENQRRTLYSVESAFQAVIHPGKGASAKMVHQQQAAHA